MKDCQHAHTTTKLLNRSFKDKNFEIEGLVCSDCSAELWTDAMSGAFIKWVGKQNNVRVQFKLSLHAEECLKRLVQDVPTSKPITLTKALILIFSMVVKSGKLEILNRAYDSEQFITFENNKEIGRNFGFDVHSLFFLDIESLANLYQAKPNELAWEALHVMLAIVFSEDEVLLKYWKEEILPKLNDFLKVA